MAKRKSPATTQPEVPIREEKCSECGRVGRAGSEVVPYSFAPKDYRWLCSQFIRDCLVKAWNKFKAVA